MKQLERVWLTGGCLIGGCLIGGVDLISALLPFRMIKTCANFNMLRLYKINKLIKKKLSSMDDDK